jgi:hypothetical protein
LAISGDDIIAMLKVIITKHQKSLDFGAIAPRCTDNPPMKMSRARFPLL